ASAARSTCFSSWATESDPRSVRRCAAPSLRSLPSTDPARGNRRPSTGCEFFLFQSLFCSPTPPGISGRKDLTALCKPRPGCWLLATSLWLLALGSRLLAKNQMVSFQTVLFGRLPTAND